mmetsp:Transcript_48067/g.70427  ORF Transcript_48067/g.70427 Transcript_48067/m.70427 type:complete len:222 (-) Transcript_48067:305-970(-)
MAKDKAGGGGKSSFAKVAPGKAKQIVDKASQEASDVIQSTQADPLKKPKQMKGAVKEEVAKLVESGDPSQVVQYIKANRKEFISGVYMSWFMKEVRAQLEGPAPNGAGKAAKPAAKNTKPAAKLSKSVTKSAPKVTAEKIKAKDKKKVAPQEKKRRKIELSSEGSDSENESEDEKPVAKKPKTKQSATSKDHSKPEASKTVQKSEEPNDSNDESDDPKEAK